ncbi:MAG: hypothetical protein FJX57_25310 [Alphaproteobacteria bacterium]|nr:hypothetical protein [Alphaproteobacteria bacterium]
MNDSHGHGRHHRHTIHFHQHHKFSWDNAHPPAMHVGPGDVVEFKDVDPTGGQLKRNATIDDLKKLDLSRANPLVGPIYVDGAEPGDALKVTLLDFASSGWGWTALLPDFGLLGDDFPFHAPTRISHHRRCIEESNREN